MEHEDDLRLADGLHPQKQQHRLNSERCQEQKIVARQRRARRP